MPARRIAARPLHRRGRLPWCALLALAVTMLPGGCGGLPLDYPRTASTAFDRPQETTLGRIFGPAAQDDPGNSGVLPVRFGHDAFTARIAMADLAERSLDLQYYIWAPDTTGRLLAQRLLQAADRGVRVRVLLDDINVDGRDERIAALSAHPHVEVRSFNPFADRSHLFDWGLDAARVNHRMHNKIMVVDGALAMVGGRNIGDHYFGVDTTSNFRDLDLLAAGPVVAEVSALFDSFWNEPHAIPFEAFVDEPPDAEDTERVRRELEQQLAGSEYPYPIDREVGEIRDHLKQVLQDLIWAPVTVLYDHPGKVSDDEEGIYVPLRQMIAEAREEFLLEVAYFVPTDDGMDVMAGLVDRGVKVRVLTNSLVGNDVLAAHAGYANYREDMLAGGVELYELQPEAGVKRRWSRLSTRSRASLHTKALVVDRRLVFVGSFNMDPRSARINTEVGLLIESEELARRIIEHLDEGVRPDNAYRVLLDDDGDLVWLGEEAGAVVVYDQDPHSTWWQRFNAGILGWLPIEGQL